MTIPPAQKAIANLIDSAERGEIDPWDVPVIEVIDRFLTELGLTETTSSPTQEADLPQSGQAFLWASMLVLLKADTLALLQAVEEAETDNNSLEETPWDEIESPNSLPSALEKQIRRRTTVQPLGKRKVTLQELIEQLEHIAAEIESVATNNRPKKKSASSRRAAMKAIAKLAHNENLTELALQLEHFLYLDFPQLAANNDEFLDWEHLLKWWQNSQNEENNAENKDSRNDRAAIFWALLLLSAQSKVELSQEEFYQDLSLRPLKFMPGF
ncbi:MAG: segregation/condensation protein A [Xenococcaceae cyanobacterium MO_167.B27]|nr:segregation/condensation protein A [Xenococcaceae cyanobacterium MO_167.B27]